MVVRSPFGRNVEGTCCGREIMNRVILLRYVLPVFFTVGLSNMALAQSGADRLDDGTSIFARCVQKSLRELGFQVGPVDGIVGQTTRRGARAYLEKFKDSASLPALSSTTVAPWCEHL